VKPRIRHVASLPDIRQLRYFEAVARHSSFSRAAGELHISQQALSEQIKKLESLLGVSLLERTTREVTVTEAGAALLDEVPKVVLALERAVTLTGLAAQRERPVSLAYTLTTANEIIPRLLRDCERVEPEIGFAPREMFASDIPEALLSMKVDLAVIPGAFEHPDLESQVIGEEPLVLVVSKDHRLAGANGTRIGDLSEETFQIWPREMSPGYFDSVVAACQNAGFEPRLDESGGGSQVWARIAEGGNVGLIAATQAKALSSALSAVEVSGDATMVISLLSRRNENLRRVKAARDLIVRSKAKGR
jgi:DNA-binding transcriptional LysR family regulator